MLFRFFPKKNITSPNRTLRKQHTASEDCVESRMRVQKVSCLLIYLLDLSASVSDLCFKQSVGFGLVDQHLGALVCASFFIIQVGHIKKRRFSRHWELRLFVLSSCIRQYRRGGDHPRFAETICALDSIRVTQNLDASDAYLPFLGSFFYRYKFHISPIRHCELSENVICSR